MEFPRSCSITSNLICLNSDTCSITECLSNNNINNSEEISKIKIQILKIQLNLIHLKKVIII